MLNGVNQVNGVPDRTSDRRSPKRDPEAAEAPATPEPADAAPPPDADLRLVIEPDAEGSSVYRLVDRATGKVVAERPQDQVAHLAEEPQYRAGTVISTKA